MSSILNLTAIEKDGSVRLATTGDLTITEIHPLEKNPFELVLGAQWAQGRVLLDFRHTHFIDSATIGWLISSQREFKNNGGVLIVHSIEPRVRRMLDLLKVDLVVKLLPDEAAARKFMLKNAA